MASSKEIHALLDRHLDVLTELGSPAAQHLGDPIPAQTVRQQLESHGYAVREDVVGYFSWREYPPLTTIMESRPTLFAGEPHPVSLEEAMQLYRDEVDGLAAEWPEWEAENPIGFPGQSYLLPVATWDVVGWTAIDTRIGPGGGGVLQCDQSSDVRLIFASLAEAIGTATYCLEAGLWTLALDGWWINQTSAVPPEPGT